MPYSKDFSRNFTIAALDFDSAETALQKVEELGDTIHFYKVGMQLFFGAGFSVVERLHKAGKKVFLDLKLNDIPNTIQAAVRVISCYSVDYLSLFCAENAISAAANVLAQTNSNLKIVKITKLTSDVSQTLQDDCQFVAEQAQKAKQSGAHGIVCSGQETSFVRQKIADKNFIIINPGIRLREQIIQNDDQSRVITPREAFIAGATHIVAGRPIFSSDNIRQTAQNIVDQIELAAK